MLLIEEPDEQEKFELIFNNYKDDMLKAAYRITKDYALAEDAVQNAFIRIAGAIKRVDMDNNPRAFAITVACNAAKSIVAKHSIECTNFDTYSTYYEVSDYNVAKEAENRDYVERVSRYVMTLKPIYRDAFVLRFLHDMKYEDMAVLLDEETATLRKRVERVKNMIFEYLGKDRR